MAEEEIMFYVGQKVVFVGYDELIIHKDFVRSEIWPKKGRIYTIAGLNTNNNQYILHLELFELPIHTATFQGIRCCNGFRHDGFRPVVENKTDISVFTKMLNIQPVKLDEQDRIRIVDG